MGGTAGTDGDGMRPDNLPRSPTGRVPQWVLDESLGRPTATTAWREAADVHPFPEPFEYFVEPRRRRRSVRSGSGATLPLLAAVAVVAALVLGLTTQGWTPFPGAGGSPSGAYRFVATQADGTTPVAYDPCRPIRVVVRPDGAPEGGGEILWAAFDDISRATGLRFIGDGTTDEAPVRERAPYQPDRYGDRWAPVLVAWVDEQENPDFAADVIGQAGSTRVSVAGSPSVYVTGQVELDAAAFTRILDESGRADVARAIVAHELGHLVGLDHVADRGQIMFPQANPEVTELAEGDLAGLAALGSGPCVPEL